MMTVFVQNIPRFNDKTPPGPDDARGGDGNVLGKRETFGGPSKVTDAGEDNGPLCPPKSNS